jgi:natural product biosynthesis luciferase-like monooxygenase protein
VVSLVGTPDFQFCLDVRLMYNTVVFVGDHPLLVACAGRAREAGLDVIGVSTQDASIGRWADGEGIEQIAWSAFTPYLQQTRPDVLLSVGNLRILPDEMVAATKVTINFHDGPLPTYAGLHTPMWALLHSDTDYSVSWHVVEGGVDEGDVLATGSFAIDPDETTRSINIKCFGAAGEAFDDLLTQLTSGQLDRVNQVGDGAYFGRYDRPIPAGAIVAQSMGADEIMRYVRALDFGPTINRVGRALLQVDESHLMVVGHAKFADTTLTGEPGSVLAVRNDHETATLTVMTANGVVELTGWTETGVDVSALSGSVLPDPTPILADIEKFHNASTRSEVWWSKRLAAVAPVDLTELGEATTTSTAEATVGFSSSSEAAAAAALFSVSRSGQQTASVGLSSSVAGEVAMAAWFSALVPVTVDFATADTAKAAVGVVSETIVEAVERGPHLRDVSIRMPVQLDTCILPSEFNVAVVADGVTTDAQIEITILDAGARYRVRVHGDDAGHASRIADGLGAFCQALTTDGSVPVVDLPVISPEETDALVELGGVPVADQFSGPLHEQFLAVATSKPDAVAAVHGGLEISFSDLETRARRVATALERAGVRPGGFVGVSTAPGLDMVVGVLGVLMSGAAYVPLDPRFPSERLAFMVSDANMDLVLTDDLAAVPDGAPAALEIGPTSLDQAIPARDVLPPVASTDLAYMMYTSGSTGLPKGVMVQHGNVDSFLKAMAPYVDDPKGDGVWLSVTTLSFDISVLELFYPLTRGWKIVLYEGLAAMRPSAPAPSRTTDSRLDMSLFFFGSEGAETSASGAYQVLLDAARFADTHGFSAVWTPERHFNAFGGPFPNPSVVGAAIAAITENVGIRSGSCVLPLHHPVRVAEEWAVVDQLSGGRVGLSIAAGWHPEDFILRPQNFGQSKAALLEQIDELRRMWRGEAVTYEGPKGPVDVLPLPRPVQAELPIWYTTAGNVESFGLAGTNGFNLLTHLLGQSLEELAEKVAAYRTAWTDAGHEGRGSVTLMLHTFVTDDDSVVRETVREPMKGYLRDSIALVKEHASSFPTFDPTKKESDGALAGLTPEDLDALLEVSFARYFETSGLFGDVDKAIGFAENIAEIDIDEIAALIDFGIDGQTVLSNLTHLNAVRDAFVDRPATDVVEPAESPEIETYGSLMEKYDVTHLQCTPSEARIILADPQSKRALGSLDKMLVGGEACPLSVAAELFDAVGGDLINVYGPTETTIWSTIHTLTQADLDGGAIPIGRPLNNTAVRVAAEGGQLRPAAAIGELLIGGDGVTAGYHDRNELTSERFTTRGDTRGRVYRTGDLVSWRPDGLLAFHGRADSQVKLRGHRIELGEIEAAFEALDTIAEAVVVVSGEGEAAALVAHLVPTADPLEATAARVLDGRGLPGHMIPERMQWHEVLPTTPNGKVDRKALSGLGPDSAGSTPEAASTVDITPTPTPSNGSASGVSLADMAALIEAAWRDVLGLDTINRNTSFFDHGGNSLQVVTLRDRLEERLGQAVSLVDLFRYGSVNELAGAFAVADAPADALAEDDNATPNVGAASNSGRINRRAAARQRARRGR